MSDIYSNPTIEQTNSVIAMVRVGAATRAPQAQIAQPSMFGEANTPDEHCHTRPNGACRAPPSLVAGRLTVPSQRDVLGLMKLRVRSASFAYASRVDFGTCLVNQ